MSGVNLFDRQSADRIRDYVRRGEARRVDLSGGMIDPAFKPELSAFRVVSDLSKEAIDSGTAVHGSEVTADFLGDVTSDFASLGNGCVSPGGQSCAGIVECFPCDLTITIVDAEGVAGTLGTVFTFVWAGSFSVSVVDECAWLYETRYVGTSANAIGVIVTLSNMGLGGFTCPYLSIRDVGRFGATDPGGSGSQDSYTLRADPSCDLMTFRAGGVSSLWGTPANRPIYTAEFTCTDQQIEDGRTLLESTLPQCVIDQIVASQTPDVGDWTVNLDLYGGVPEPGSILHAKNVGGIWRAIGARNLRVVGDLADETGPDRIEAGGCISRQVPFAYMNAAMGEEVTAGGLHFCTWHRQTRKYIATRWEGC